MKNAIRRKMPVVALTAVVVAALAVFAFAREKYEEKFAKTVDIAKDGRVYLGNISGNISITTWRQNQVKIDAVKVSEASSLDKAKENAASVTIDVATVNGVLRIETKYPEKKHFWEGDRGNNVSVSYVLTVPEMAAVEVKSVSGDVKLGTMGGAVKVGNVSGEVSVLGAPGVDVDLVSGDITVENITGDAYLKSVSGNIGATKVKGSLEAGSVSGEVTLKDVSEARSVKAHSVSGNITYTGTIMASGNYEFESFSGNVELKIPANAGFEFEADTFSGVIDSDFPIEVSGKISPKEIRGTVNKGGARIRLKSFSGNVDLKKY